MRILAVIPAFNEEECIANTVSMLADTCPDIDYLVINDGSSDQTATILSDNKLNYVTLPINTRLASAFRTGMKYALSNNYDAVIQFDADGQHLPEYINAMASALDDEYADIVIGSRYLTGDKPSGARGLGQLLISALIRLTTRQVITDPTSGLRLYGRSMIDHFAHDFDIAPEPDMIALMARKGRKIVEVPVRMQERQGGKSYFDLPNIVSYMARTCVSIILFQWLR